MARLLCDVCGVRPATVRLSVLQNGQRQVLDVCDFPYAQITRHQRAISPLEAPLGAQAPELEADASQQSMESTEFINRIDDIILFKSLSRDETRHIVRLHLDSVSRLASSQTIDLIFRDSIVDHLVAEDIDRNLVHGN